MWTLNPNCELKLLSHPWIVKIFWAWFWGRGIFKTAFIASAASYEDCWGTKDCFLGSNAVNFYAETVLDNLKESISDWIW